MLLIGGCVTSQQISNNDITETATPTATFTPTPTPPDPQTASFKWEGKNYEVSWFKVSKPESLRLIANFQSKLSSSELIEKFACQKGINAGFYDQEDKPLGIFINDQTNRRNKLDSDLFNGIFYLTNENFVISEDLPEENIRIALQSGPLLISDSKVLPLKIKEDELARRMVVAINEEEIIFLSVYNAVSNLQGPYLADLPKIIEKFSQQSKIKINDALNLDGGSASAFYNERTSLTEITSVGGFFCVK